MVCLSSFLVWPFRRSGLQDRLTAAEVRRLVEKLRRKRPGDHGAAMIDYERCVGVVRTCMYVYALTYVCVGLA